MNKVLVTGGSGFLGRRVIKTLESQDITCAALDNVEPRCGADPNFSAINVDITDFHQLENIIVGVGFDTIIHLAAYGRNLSCQDFAERAYEVNVTGTYNVLEIARQHPDIVKRVVVCSSNIALSDVPTIYRMTKNLTEALVREYAALGVSCMGLRPSNICGVGQSRTEYQQCAMAMMDVRYERDGFITIEGDGSASRDFVNVKDVARAFLLAAGSELIGETLDVCTGKLTSVMEVVKMVGVPFKHVEPRKGDAKTLVSDPNPAWFKLGFSAEIGIEQTVRESFPFALKHE
jgi:UDP-glucose 4-epimerase